MARVIVAMLSVVTMFGLGIAALAYRQEALDGAGLTGNEAEALNLTREVTSGSTAIAGNALPRLFVVVLLVFMIVLLLLARP